MQKIAVRVAPLSKPISSAQQAARVQPPHTAPRLAEVWRSTMETAITHAAPLLLLGVIGFAAVPLLGLALAVFALPFTRIALSQIATQGRLHGMTVRHLAAALLIGWVYFAVLCAGQILMSVSLQAWGFNLNFVDQKIATWQEAPKAIALRCIIAFTNATGQPFVAELRQWRNEAFDIWANQPNTQPKRMADYWQRRPDAAISGIANIESQMQTQSWPRSDLRLLFIAGALMIFAAETLLAFRSMMSVKLVGVLWLNLKHFGTVAGHLWLLRSALVVLKAVFVFAPMVVVDRFSYLAQDWNWFGSPMQGMALASCLGFIHAVASTFEAVYVARLYSALVNPRG